MEPGTLTFVLPSTSATDTAGNYHNAQVIDYAGLPRSDYPWHPPLRMTVRASFSARPAELTGTAGFGFWNQPFMPGQRWPRLPRAAWFFMAGQPSDIALAAGVPGSGLKAATLDATRPAFLALAPLAPIAMPLMRIRSLYRRLYPMGQRALGVAEAIIDPGAPGVLRTYMLEWRPGGLRFAVDGQTMLEAPFSPRGPLGFIAWMDNQHAIVTPQGRFGFGLTPILMEQQMTLTELRIEPL